tara:strand:+ start:486 stop:1646 length:1161 start_codon:yes stop_codon:yes gene_type:complete
LIPTHNPELLHELALRIKSWGKALGFSQVGICDVNLSEHQAALQSWLDKGYHGQMHFMERHGSMRTQPDTLLPGTIRIISVSMNYLPPEARFAQTLSNPSLANISRYATGRDYHKLMRQRLKKLALKIEQELPELNYRPFVDSAPVLERPIAVKAGLGWVGKHSLVLNKESGSWFFLGELFVNIPLPLDQEQPEQCGTCRACVTSCPTDAIVSDAVIDARRCISYLTIEHDDAIPLEFRKPMGNRIYGCDDCQLVCPFNRDAPLTAESDFHLRKQWQNQELMTLFLWDEATFLKQTEGSPIRRIGHQRWRRNISVALGNAPASTRIVQVLQEALPDATGYLVEHLKWAIEQQEQAIAKELQHNKDIMSRGTQRLIRIIEKGLPRDA